MKFPLLDTRAIVLLAVIGITAGGAVATRLLDSTARSIIIAEATRTSTAWAHYIGAEFERIEEVAAGAALLPEEADFLLGVQEFGNVFRFKLFDKNGGLRLVSDHLGTKFVTAQERAAEHSNTAKLVVETGNPVSKLEDGTAKKDRPILYSETYVPVFRNDDLVAVVEVYIDETARESEVTNDFIRFGSKIAGAVLVGISVPCVALFIMVRLVRRQNRRLEEAERAKSNFFTHMNHELRTPLNSIIGYAQMLSTEQFGKIGNEKYREYVDDIQSSGNHLLSLINKVLDMSKIEAGQFTVEEDRLVIGDAVRDAVHLLSQQIDRKHISVIVGPDCDRHGLLADVHLCRQILLNLLNNAVKFSRLHGTIAVHSDIDDQGCTRITIVDNGAGIARTDLQRVVEPFGQSRVSAHVSHEVGTGLGLPLCIRMMELHGGTLELDSELGRGTTVTLIFPKERTIPPEPAPVRLST